MLKTIEKLFDLHLKQVTLKLAPFHNMQFAYQKNKSCLTALHYVVKQIEHTLEFKGIVLGAFMDISGAFDNANFDAIAKALGRRNCHRSIINWINNMLITRRVQASLGDEELTVGTTRGCPQGGVLSPQLWTFIVDELVTILNNQGFKTVCYADDIVILINGADVKILHEYMQEALRITWEWCENNSLSINPSKTSIIKFTRKRNAAIEPLKIKNTIIPFSNTVKYLGVMLDNKLTWNEHIDYIKRKAMVNLFTMKKLASNYTGLSPEMAKYLYNQTIIPTITYGALVWWPKTNQTTTNKKLNIIQRLGLITITGAIRTTPTASLELITGIKPLHITIKEKAIEQIIQLTNTYTFKEGDLKGHLNILNTIPELLTMTRHKNSTLTTYTHNKRYTIIFPLRLDWDKNEWINNTNSLNIFTDGSKTSTGTGAGIHSEEFQMAIPLHPSCNIFEAELHAILVAATELIDRNTSNSTINIFSDSQAVLKALNRFDTTSKSVIECVNVIQKLGLRNRVTLIWVLGKHFPINSDYNKLPIKGLIQILRSLYE